MQEKTFTANELCTLQKEGKTAVVCALGDTFKIIIKKDATVCCVRLFGFHFETSKCFLLPTAMAGIKKIKSQYDKYPGSAVLIVGHADTRGGDSYNSELSIERADAIQAFLQDKVNAWLTYYNSSNSADKRWGTREDQYMLSILPEGKPAYYTGKIDGIAGPDTTKAIKVFQQDTNLNDDGIAGPDTRTKLIEKYMSLDSTSLPADSSVTTYGCGEFFPVVPASADAPSTEEEEKRQAKNRRVEVFFFKDGIKPPPPGKQAEKDSPEYPQWRAAATEVIDVESNGSSTDPDSFWIRCHDSAGYLVTTGYCKVASGSSELANVSVDAEGWAKVDLPPGCCYEQVDVSWGSPSSSGPFQYTQALYVDCSAGDEKTTALVRLHNLGYDTSEFDFAVRHFQTNYAITDASGHAEVGLTADGFLPENTKKKLDEIYDKNNCTV